MESAPRAYKRWMVGPCVAPESNVPGRGGRATSCSRNGPSGSVATKWITTLLLQSEWVGRRKQRSVSPLFAAGQVELLTVQNAAVIGQLGRKHVVPAVRARHHGAALARRERGERERERERRGG